MSEKEDFDAFTRANGLGRREDIENYPDVPAAPQYEMTRQVAQELIDSARLQYPGLGPIHFDFINNPHIGAWDFRLNNGYGIGLTSGTLILVGMVFHYMLSTRSLFPRIGLPDAERSSLPPIPWDVLNAETLYGDGVMPVAPLGRERSLYALHLTHQALNFLVGHELAHITRGHVDYLQNNSGCRFAEGIGWSGTKDTQLIRQALELDADSRSVLARIASAHNTFHKNPNGMKPEWANEELSILDWHFDWAFAVSTVFRLFGDRRFRKEDLLDSYPPFPVRQLQALRFACTQMAQPESTASTHVWQFLKYSAEQVEHAYTSINGLPSEGGFAQASEDATILHLEAIKGVWSNLRKDIQTHSLESL